ncbi:dual specificity protein phosphatase family protein [Halohasta litorea]|uniref:Dual specificity protein phosphatase family protein n=1 Tax=Halohasta litorea TaxID=869891 RepID=A0ABD6DCQ6_9EURY|nr:dual specificity protein phosphatase [Halohasta litorea]
MNEIIPHLHIGDARTARALSEIDNPFDEVVTVGYARVLGRECPRESTTGDEFVFPDGPHEYETFEAAADYVLDAVESGEVTFVHCQAGVSRSCSVCAAVLAVHSGGDVDEARRRVKQVRPRVDPEQEVWSSATRYVDEHPRTD